MENKQNYRRFLNRDGSLNIDRRGYKKTVMGDLYHNLLSTSWPKLIFFVSSAYIFINLFFGASYFVAGKRALDGINASSGLDRFVSCFFFSVQTLATIGYGRISPNSFGAQALVTVEALFGLLGLALVTGIIFARFSRPTSRVIFSDKAIISQIDGQSSLVFRLANARMNQIVEAQLRVVLARTEVTSEGLTFRELYDLKLERERSPPFLHELDGRASHRFGKPASGGDARELSGKRNRGDRYTDRNGRDVFTDGACPVFLFHR